MSKVVIDGHFAQQDSAKVYTAVAGWMLCSVGMLVFNKLAISSFPLPCTLVAMQMAFTVLMMLVCGWPTLHFGSKRDVLRWSVVVPFFVGMVLTSMFALKTAPLSLVITFRALAPLFSLVIEYMFFSKPPVVTAASLFPLSVIILGAVLYAKDLERSSSGLAGIGWVMVNTCFSLGDRLLQRRLLSKDEQPVDISTTGATLLNNLFGLVPLLAVAMYTQEHRQVVAVMQNLHSREIAWILASCTVGVGISFSGILVQGLISATSFLVLINANKFVVLLLEMAVLHTGNTLSPTQLSGAMMAVLGSLLWGMGRDEWQKVLASVGILAFAAEEPKLSSNYGAVYTDFDKSKPVGIIAFAAEEPKLSSNYGAVYTDFDKSKPVKCEDDMEANREVIKKA